MDKAPRKILRSPSVKRKSKLLPVGQKLTLERVLGLTVSSNAAFSCDPVHGTIAYPAGCVVVLFNPRRNRQSHIFNVSKKTITSVAFSGDGKHLVTGECGHQPAVRVWDVEEKTQVAEFHGHKFGVNCVAFSPNLKYIVSIGSQHDMMVNVWNWRTGNKVASNKVSCKVNAVSFGADSASFVTVGNRHVKFWYLDSSKSKINQTVPLSGRSGILAEQKNNFFCDVVCGQGKYSGSTFVITQSGLLCEFNEKRLLDKWVELRTKCASCITAGEEHIFIGCAEGVVRVFSASSLHFITTLPHPHHLGVEVATATTSSDMICTKTDAKYPDVIAITVDDDHKKVACVYNDHSLYVWDVLNVRRVGKAWSFLFHSGCVWALEVYPRLENNQTGVLPPGSFLTASSDDTIRVWNLDPQMTETPGYKRNIYSSELLKVVYTDPSHAFLCDVNYNPAGATDKTDTTWDGKNGVRSIRVSPDGEHLASGDRQGNIRVYDLHQMSEIRAIEAHESDVVCLEYSFSKIGPRILASGSRDRLIHVFDAEQQYGLLQTLDDHSAAIQSVRFTDDNNKLRMLSCGSDKSLLFRNASLNPPFEFSLSHHLVSKATMYDMIIDPTQKYVATACQDRHIRVYNMATAKQKKNYRGAVGDEGTLLRVQLDPSGTYAATSCTDKNLSILEFYTGEMTATAYGHSEIATGLRFTNDLKHLISVSADGCIFVWRLSSDMTKTMRSRMEELGKMPQEEPCISELRKEAGMMPNPVSLDSTFTTSSANFSVIKENISPARVLSSMNIAPSLSKLSTTSSFVTTPISKQSAESSSGQSSQGDHHFSVGPLPKWAKAKFEDVKDGTDGSADSIQPKGRWAQRFDQNLAFKSQLDLSQLDDDSDGRRLTDTSGLQGVGDLTVSMPDLRRETVVLSQSTPAKNIPIIDDDDVTNIDDEEDFFPAFMKNKLLGTSAESDRNSSDNKVVFKHEDRRRQRQSDPVTRRLGGLDPRRWGSRVSLGNEDKANSIDFDDTDDQDTWSETTEVIYPPSEPESVDTFASTFKVFAVEGGRKTTKRTSNVNLDEDSESTEHLSLEDQDEEEGNEETLPTSSASTPSDPEREFMPRTPDKELFVKENFESVSFTPVAMDKFAQQVATLERAAEVADPASLPFSPRLSLSSRFLSRSQFGAARAGGGLGGGQRPDSWFDQLQSKRAKVKYKLPLRKNKSEMARAMDETRKRLADMNWRTGGLLQESPEKEDPPSPPTKLDSKEPNFSSTPKIPTNTDFGGKLERDTSPIPSSPTRAMPSSPVSGSALMAAKDKQRNGNGMRSAETNGGCTTLSSAAVAPPPRQVPSYFRTTKSSRLKSSSSSSLLRQTEVQNTKAPTNSMCNSKTEGPAKKRITKGRLSSSRLAMYASTPNLANFHEEKEDLEEEAKPQAEPSQSNLLLLADLSRSVPGDINALDDPASTDSSSSSGTVMKTKDKTEAVRQGAKSFSPSRRSLPAGNLDCTELRLTLAKQGDGLTDTQLMPPPSKTFQPSKATQSSLLKKAVQVRNRSTSELTLEQAKSILLGNSGILGSQQVSPEEEPSTLKQPPGEQRKEPGTALTTSSSTTLCSVSARSSSSARSNSTSTLNFMSSRNNSTSSRTNLSSSNVFDGTDTPVYTSANTLTVAEEIDRTANQLRRERERAAAAALDASRYDPPERDQPSPQKPQTTQASSSSRVTFCDSARDREGSVSGNEDAPKMSVQERIAILNQQTPKSGSPESMRLSLDCGPGHNPSSNLVVKSGRSSMSSPVPTEPVQSQPTIDQRVSPRSQSDTGLGSDTDTDSDARFHQTGDVGAARGNRSRLTLHLSESSSSLSQPASSLSSNEDSLRTCMSVVSDLKLAVERAKDFLSQMNSGNTASSANQRQITSVLSEAFREAHLTLAHMSLQSPVMDSEEGRENPPKPPSCPLVPESAAGAGWDSSVMDKARDMLQPFMAHLSRELSEELVKLIRDRLDGRPPPSAQ